MEIKEFIFNIKNIIKLLPHKSTTSPIVLKKKVKKEKANKKKSEYNFFILLLYYLIIGIKTRQLVYSLILFAGTLISLDLTPELYGLFHKIITNPYYAEAFAVIIPASQIGLGITTVIYTYFKIGKIRKIVDEQLRKFHGELEIRIAKIIVGKERFLNLMRSMQNLVRGYIELTGDFDNSVFFIMINTAKAIDYAVLSAFFLSLFYISVYIFSVLTSISVPAIFTLLVTLILVLIPIIYLLTPFFKYYSEYSTMISRTPYELPFFTILASIALSSGLTLTYIFDKLRKELKHNPKNVLMPAFSMESRAIIRDIKTFGISLIQVLSRRAEKHPIKDYSMFLYGYTSIVSGGGDIVGYIGDKAKEFMRMLELKWEIYAEKVGTINEMILILFVFLPEMMAVLSIFNGGGILSALLIFPLAFTPVLYLIVSSSKPKTMNQIKYNPVIAIVPAIIVGLIGSTFLLPYQDVFIASLVFLILLYIQVRDQVRDIRDSLNALPDFLRSLTEFRKIGYTLNMGIMRTYEITSSTSENRSMDNKNGYQDSEELKEIIKNKRSGFPKKFDELLSNVYKQLKSGVPLNQVRIKTSSWLNKLTFYILSILTESGYIPVSVMEDMTNFMSGITQIYKETISKTKGYKMMAIFIPVFMTFSILFSVSLISLFNSQGASTSITALPITSKLCSTALCYVYVFIEISAIGISIVMTKVTEETIACTKLAIISLIISFISIVSYGYVQPVILSFLKQASLILVIP
ncbi:MAG: type II secretion system F family protein [Acidianus sp.]|jgi:flagellar protein FlaJ|nr:type II secretion system F family protein [Acidianus sp.]